MTIRERSRSLPVSASANVANGEPAALRPRP